MIEIFMNEINELLSIINEPIDSIYKITAINNHKKKLNMGQNDLFGQMYYKLLTDIKSNGIVYTPNEISEHMIKNTITDNDIIENPFIRILDPSCGIGNFIIPLYNYLVSIYSNNLIAINKQNGINLKEKDITRHIIENNIFGYDINTESIKALLIDLYSISGYINVKNVIAKDYLLDEIDLEFNIIIGNPPYVGHKTIEKDYSAILKENYSSIYKDKGDLSYCFFTRSISLLKKKGKLSFITSRYFLESPSGEELRKVLKNYCRINKIIDFYGIRPFKGIGIDPVILFIQNEELTEYEIDIIKPNRNVNDRGKGFYESIFKENGFDYTQFKINKNLLNNKGWILRDEASRKIINKIEKKSFTTLSNICESFQGIITGCDNAFVVSEEIIEKNNLEKNILKPWIKSSYIRKYEIDKSNKYLIYSNLINDEGEFPESIKYISVEKTKLEKRRECVNGIRKWYELQWGRNYKIFEGEKIIFPYKSNNNRFALDSGSYFSADVYCIKLKENVPFTYEYLLEILNSDLYEYYFKSFAKKLGENQYEYYPNTIMKLCIPTMESFKPENKNWIYEFFELEEDEIKVIKEDYYQIKR